MQSKEAICYIVYRLYTIMCTKLYGISFRWILQKTFGNAGDSTTNVDI